MEADRMGKYKEASLACAGSLIRSLCTGGYFAVTANSSPPLARRLSTQTQWTGWVWRNRSQLAARVSSRKVANALDSFFLRCIRIYSLFLFIIPAAALTCRRLAARFKLECLTSVDPVSSASRSLEKYAALCIVKLQTDKDAAKEPLICARHLRILQYSNFYTSWHRHKSSSTC